MLFFLPSDRIFLRAEALDLNQCRPKKVGRSSICYPYSGYYPTRPRGGSTHLADTDQGDWRLAWEGSYFSNRWILFLFLFNSKSSSGNLEILSSRAHVVDKTVSAILIPVSTYASKLLSSWSLDSDGSPFIRVGVTLISPFVLTRKFGSAEDHHYLVQTLLFPSYSRSLNQQEFP